MRNALKTTAGYLASTVAPQCSYERAVLILGHMRCGSTALANVLCSRSEINGYGETHVCHDGGSALGRVAVNQMRRGRWNPRAQFMFDKILHSRHDAAAPAAFYRARAIFLARAPDPAVRSIRRLFAILDKSEYDSDAAAAEYYADRVEVLLSAWDRFPEDRRVGLTHVRLLAAPEAALARISALLGLDPPLENRYESPPASLRGGGGDPLESGRHGRIIARGAAPRPGPETGEEPAPPLDIPPALRTRMEALYQRYCDAVALSTTVEAARACRPPAARAPMEAPR